MISYDEIKPVIDKLFARTATVQDRLFYVRFELQEIMKALPPVNKSNESDGWHASACALRAFSVLIGLERDLPVMPSNSHGKARGRGGER